MGELQHGIYDDECKGLTEEEINAFYDFDNDGESQVLDKSADKTDSDSDDSDDSDSATYDDGIHDLDLEEPEMDEELDEELDGSEDDHDVIIPPFIIQ